MNKTTRGFLFWTPRIVCILFALFISLFALDVFEEDYSVFQTIIALLIHLIPTGIIVLVLVLSWRREWIGAFLFISFAMLYLLVALGRISI